MPYRTSFSAKYSVERIPGSDRSRSLSPTSSLRSVQSSRSGRLGRAKSPKRVTYDTRVTIRHSDADDSMFAELSSREFEPSPRYSPTHKSASPSLHSSQLSKDSGLDYSMELRDLSDQIIKMNWSRDRDELDASRGSAAGAAPSPSPHGILKESQNSHKQPGSRLSPTSQHQPPPSRTPPASRGDKENTPNGSPPPQAFSPDRGNTPKSANTISRDYQHDRTFSYRRAISDHYSSEVRALVDAGIEEKPPSALSRENGGLLAQQRSTSTISTISGDESIGECSLDCNLTASEPSLLSGTSQSAGSTLSKKAVLNQSLISSTESQLPSDTAASTTDSTRNPLHRQKDALVLGQELLDSVSRLSNKENASPLSPLSPVEVTDSTRKPSYLKLSCAVSGYGKYSRYSSYKGIPTRSPFSSTSSLRSDLSSPDPTMPSLRSPDDLGTRSPGLGIGGSPSSGAAVMASALSNGQSRLMPALNGHSVQAPGLYPTGDAVKDGEYFLGVMAMEEDRLNQQAKRAEGLMRSQDLPEEVNGRIRAAIGKSNLLITQKFQQFRELCSQHMHPEPEDRVPLYEDLQGFWDMIKIQVENVDDMFAEIEHMSQNGWKEIPKMTQFHQFQPQVSWKPVPSHTPSATPGHTPGSKRRGLKPNNKDTPESSPEHTQKIRSATKARDEARKKMLAEKRAAMKQQQQQQKQEGAPDIEIFLPEDGKK
nr:hypothetical protein BaRGS_017172 [Batillaria attramentaria]